MVVRLDICDEDRLWNADYNQDSNPEAVIVGSPLDRSRNPRTTQVGDTLQDVTGIVTYAYGYYAILPLTNLSVTHTVEPATAPPTKLVSSGECHGITIGDYNVENLMPNTAHLRDVAAHIVDYLKTPDLMMVQEIQDDSGSTNNGSMYLGVAI